MAQAAGQRWVLPRDEKSVAVMCDPPVPPSLSLSSLSLSTYIPSPLSLSSPHLTPARPCRAGRGAQSTEHATRAWSECEGCATRASLLVAHAAAIHRGVRAAKSGDARRVEQQALHVEEAWRVPLHGAVSVEKSH